MAITFIGEMTTFYNLKIFRPWKSSNKASFSFEKNNQGRVKVTWKMTGSLPFFMFFFKKMMSAWIGSDYERGLLMLKDYVETGEVLSKVDYKEKVFIFS